MTNPEVDCVLGADVGSSSCKTVVLDAHGRVVAEAAEPYPCLYPAPGFVEQDPEAWFRAFCKAVGRIFTTGRVNPGNIRGICLAGVTHNPVLLDADENVLRNAIHFWDKRSIPQVKQIKDRWGDLIRRLTLNEPDPLWTWPQLLWIREQEPDLWRRITFLLFPKDYVRHRLAPSLITDCVDPVGTLLFDPRNGQWIQDFVNDLGLPLGALPEVVSPTTIVGQISQEAAADTGLAAGTPVLAGTTDTAAELLGSGAVEPGQAVVKLASVGRIMVVADEPLSGPTILNYPHAVNGLWYPGSVTKHGAGAYAWVKSVLWNEYQDDDAYARMDSAAAEIPAGSDGVVFHPHLSGEYAPQWDPKLRASFIGLNIRHTRVHMTRSVLEGVAFQIKSALEQLREYGGRWHKIRLIGGGASSPLWSQIMADVFGDRLIVPNYRSAAYGAGLMAGIATGIISSEFDPLTSAKTFEPDQARSDLYQRCYGRYRWLDEELQPISHKLEALFSGY